MSKTTMTRLMLALCLGALTFSHTGCNTTKGAGQDMQRAGENIQNAADDARH